MTSPRHPCRRSLPCELCYLVQLRVLLTPPREGLHWVTPRNLSSSTVPSRASQPRLVTKISCTTLQALRATSRLADCSPSTSKTNTKWYAPRYISTRAQTDSDYSCTSASKGTSRCNTSSGIPSTSCRLRRIWRLSRRSSRYEIRFLVKKISWRSNASPN
jgi:hypothetical protein